MKKVLLLPNNTDLNRGDQALVWESIRLIEDIYNNDVYISIIESGVSSDDIKRQSWQTHERGYHLISPILKHPSRFSVTRAHKRVNYGIFDVFLWGLVALYDLFTSSLLLSNQVILNVVGTLFLSQQENATLACIKEADYVYVKGGGFIHSYGKITDGYQMYYNLFLILLAQRYGKNIYFFPNSIGPIKNKYAKKLVNMVLEKAKVVSVRENISKIFLDRYLSISCQKYSDLGYYLEDLSSLNAEKYMSKYINTKKKIVGITLRPWRFPDVEDCGERYKEYVCCMSKFVEEINKDGFQVVFFVHTLGPSAHENDFIAINDVVSTFCQQNKYPIIKDEKLNCYDMMRLYGQCDYFVGTRFHSVIFAQNMYVPAISISYGGNKGIGIMEELNLSQFAININDVSFENLIYTFHLLTEQEMYYKKCLAIHKTILADERRNLIKVCREQ